MVDDGVEIPYDGPYVHSRHGTAAVPWVWIANGTRSAEEMFGAPHSVSGPAVALPEPVGVETDASDDGRPSPKTSDDAAPPAAIVRVLGPVEVEGWRQAPERAIVVELACFLALHVGRPISGDEVRFALRPDGETEISAKSLRTYVSLLRSALGADLVPPATSTGYRISPAVATDWAQFQALSRAEASRDDLAAAMSLVRGRPFAGVPAGSYGWVFTELLISEMEAAIASTAVRLANAYFGDRAFRSALWAARRGLVGVPGDLRLWEYYLAFARSTGPTEWSAARREARVVLGEDAKDLLGRDPTPAELASAGTHADEDPGR
jgi:hypothetical protein